MSPIAAPSASRQIAFHQLLVAARKTWLMDALSEALKVTDPKVLKAEIASFVPDDAQKILASAGIRDEHVFPTPALLKAKPTLVGYYRLLLGVPQKSFYGTGTGMVAFKSMETKGILRPATESLLPDFCKAMCAELAELIRQVSPQITLGDVHDLPLLTIGSQFQGGNNNTIGQKATLDVFLAVAEIVSPHIVKRTETEITVKNAAGRTVAIKLGSDPDVQIRESVGGTIRKKVAIEIKGGTDKSNAHNRAGEAEKSHQKAKKDGFLDFWTIIAKKGLNMGKIQDGSPTTNTWFDVSQVLGRTGSDYDDFRNRIIEVVGIPLS